MRQRLMRSSHNRPHDAVDQALFARLRISEALLRARELLRRAAADRVDVVHVATTGPLAVVALIFACAIRLPDDLIVSASPRRNVRALYAELRSGLVRQSRRLLVTSMAARKAFLRAGVSASKIVVWRPGVDASMFAPSKRSAVLRERWGVSDARPAVIYAGAHVRRSRSASTPVAGSWRFAGRVPCTS